MKLTSTDRKEIQAELFAALDENTPSTTKELAIAYEELPASKRSAWLAEFQGDKHQVEAFTQLTQYWANRSQLIAKAAMIASQNQLEESQKAVEAALEEAKQAKPTLAIDTNDYVFTHDIALKRKLEDTRTTFKKEKLDPVVETPVLQGSIYAALRDAALKKVPAAEAVATVHAMYVELIHTEHPTNPLAKEVSEALKALKPGISDGELQTHVKTLVASNLVPHQKRTVPEEVQNDLAALSDNYDNFAVIRKRIHTAFKAYYPDDYALIKDALDEALGIVSPAREKAGKQAAKGFMPSGGWAGFDADGNMEMTPVQTEYAVGQRRLRAAEKHAKYIETVIIPAIPLDEGELRGGFEALQVRLESYAAKVKEDPHDRALKKEDLTGALSAIWEAHEVTISEHSVLDEAVRNFAGQIQNFGLAMGRGDIRQKSFKNQRVLTTILEDLKNDPEVNELDIFKVLLAGKEVMEAHAREALEAELAKPEARDKYGKETPEAKELRIRLYGPTFADLSEEQKQAFQKQLLDGSLESQKILQRIRQKFEPTLDEESYYQTAVDSYDYIKPIAVIKNGKETLFEEVDAELTRASIAARHGDIVQKNIISNTEETSDLFTQDIIQSIFGAEQSIATMPLMEDIRHLDGATHLLEPYLQFKVQRELERQWDNGHNGELQAFGINRRDDIAVLVSNGDDFKAFRAENPGLDAFLKPIVLHAMAGPSDSSREGSTAALLSISRLEPTLQSLADTYGVGFSFFYGIGADIGRGGETQNSEQQTGQGNFKHNVIANPEMQLRKTERQTEQGFRARLSLDSRPVSLAPQPSGAEEKVPDESYWTGRRGTSLDTEREKQREAYKQASKDSYEELYREQRNFTDVLHGFGDLMGVLYGITAHTLITAPNNYSSRATVLGKADSDHPCVQWKDDWSVDNPRPDLPVSVDRLRAITKTWDDEIPRHYTNIIFGPGFGLKALKKEQHVDLYEHDATFRDILDKTAIGLAMSDFGIEWETFPEVLRPYDMEGNLDRGQLQERAERAREEIKSKMADGFDIASRLKEGPHSTEFQEVVEMVADLNCLLHEEALQTQECIYDLFRTVYFEQGRDLPEKPGEPTDLLFYRPELQAHCEQARRVIEPLSRLNATINHGVFIEGKGLNTLYPDSVKPMEDSLDLFRVLTGNIAVGHEAYRADVPAHYDPNYLDLRRNILTGKDRAQKDKATAEKTVKERVDSFEEMILSGRNAPVEMAF